MIKIKFEWINDEWNWEECIQVCECMEEAKLKEREINRRHNFRNPVIINE